jgi:hypothetical protein
MSKRIDDLKRLLDHLGRISLLCGAVGVRVNSPPTIRLRVNVRQGLRRNQRMRPQR